jgi:hypothetical protein
VPVAVLGLDPHRPAGTRRGAGMDAVSCLHAGLLVGGESDKNGGDATIHMLCLNCAYLILHESNGLVRVGPVGLEPTTYGLKVRSSAN